jgi:hypothetical protein
LGALLKAQEVMLMAARSNAIAELTRFWLQIRHNCLVNEAVAVKVFYGNSDIDLVAMRPDLSSWTLPDGAKVKRVIVETKDEHDYDRTGHQTGKRLRTDISAMRDGMYIPRSTGSYTKMRVKVKFSMLREEHYMVAKSLFGTADFDRIFVLHAIDKDIRNELGPELTAKKRIHLFTVHEIVNDLRDWYATFDGKAALRHTLMGDLWHLLVGYYGFSVNEDIGTAKLREG